MKGLTKCVAGLLVMFLMGLYLPQKSMGSTLQLQKNFDKSRITHHEPKVLSTPVKMIPGSEKKDASKKSLKKYLLIGLASVVVVGGAAAAAAGSSDDGGSDSDSGNILIEW